jgi:hypothetical protein
MATQEIILSDNNKQPSERLQQLINECAIGFQKLGQHIKLTLQVGREEGFTDKEIGARIRQQMQQAGLDSSTIRRHLPASCKRNYTITKDKQSSTKSRNLHDLGLDNPTQLNHEQLTKLQKAQLIEIIQKLQQIVSVSNSNSNSRNLHESKRISSSNNKLDKNANLPKSKLQNKPYNGNHQWISNEKIDKILQLHNEGKSSRTISNIIGISKNTVLRRLKLAAENSITSS